MNHYNDVDNVSSLSTQTLALWDAVAYIAIIEKRSHHVSSCWTIVAGKRE